jgi:hypothetical protein
LPLGTQATQHLIEGAAELQIARGCLTSPHAATHQQLLLTTTPAFMVEQFGHRRIIQSRAQPGDAALLLKTTQQLRKGLIETGIPGHIANQFQRVLILAFPQAQTSRQHGITSHQDTTARTATIEQIQPMAISDLAQMAETASLFNRPETLGIAAIDPLPGQPLGQRLKGR